MNLKFLKDSYHTLHIYANIIINESSLCSWGIEKQQSQQLTEHELVELTCNYKHKTWIDSNNKEAQQLKRR